MNMISGDSMMEEDPTSSFLASYPGFALTDTISPE
jgi:hypothetical protein